MLIHYYTLCTTIHYTPYTTIHTHRPSRCTGTGGGSS
jgi:hypothetical protein